MTHDEPVMNQHPFRSTESSNRRVDRDSSAWEDGARPTTFLVGRRCFMRPGLGAAVLASSASDRFVRVNTMKYLVFSVLAFMVLSSVGNAQDAKLTEDAARKLLPRAAGISNADFKAL